MKSAGFVALGVAAGLALAAVGARPTACCARVAAGARAKAVGAAGPFGWLVGGAWDVLGLNAHVPGWLDKAGVPIDA